MGRLRAAPLDLAAMDLEPPGRLLVRVGGRKEAVGPRLARVRELVGQGVELRREEEHGLWDGVREFDWVPAEWNLMKVPMTTKRIGELEEDLRSIRCRRRYCAGGNLAWLAWSGPLDPLDRTLAGLDLDRFGHTGRWSRATTRPCPGQGLLQKDQDRLDPDARFRRTRCNTASTRNGTGHRVKPWLTR